MVGRIRILALAGALLVTGSPEDDTCKRCDSTGLLECKTCAKDPCSESETLLFCSVRLTCKTCAGIGRVDCKKCEIEPAEDLATQRDAGLEWLAGMRAIDTFMQEDLRHAESEHFKLTYDIRRSLGVKGGETPHGGMHIYLERLEALFALFVADVSADPEKDFFGKTHVMLWDKGPNQEKASLQYTHQPSDTQSKLMGAEPVVSIYYDKSHLHEEFELHQAVVHQVTHCLLSNVYDGIWPGNINGGWIDAGLAHYYEVSLFGSVRHYCYVEGDTMRIFKFGVWEPSVRKAVDKDDAIPFLGVTSRHTTELTPEEHMYSWSYVDFLLKQHPGKFGPLAKSLKQKQSTKDALQSSLELSPFAFEAAWKEFVKAEYSLKPKKKR
jgi:hypothetical protein